MQRREKLRELIVEHGGPAALARKLGYENASFLVQMAGPNPSRPVTEKTARNIENKLGLPKGWLNSSEQSALETRSQETDFLRATIQAADKMKLTLSPNKLLKLADFSEKYADSATTELFISDLLSLFDSD